MSRQQLGRSILRGVGIVAGTLYFIVDAILLAALRPIGRWLARLPFWRRAEDWTARLAPYPTLLVFLVPVALLEPIKPLAAWLAHDGHGVLALLLFGVGEIIKVIVVERLFARNRDKLLTIGWFARFFGFWQYVKSLLTENPAWRAAVRHTRLVWRKLRRLMRSPRRQTVQP